MGKKANIRCKFSLITSIIFDFIIIVSYNLYTGIHLKAFRSEPSSFLYFVSLVLLFIGTFYFLKLLFNKKNKKIVIIEFLLILFSLFLKIFTSVIIFVTWGMDKYFG